MLRFELLCDSYRYYKGHVSKLTEKSSGIDSNKSATVKMSPRIFPENLRNQHRFDHDLII